MKKYDWSDRKLKIAVLLAIAIIGWFCLKGASAAHGQTTPAHLSPAAHFATRLPACDLDCRFLQAVGFRGEPEIAGLAGFGAYDDHGQTVKRIPFM